MRPTLNPRIGCTPQTLWHLRFGHPPSTTLRKHPYIHSTFDSTQCTVCTRAKSHRKPFRKASHRATKKGERLHSDIGGPYPISKGEAQYVVTLLDEATHWCWTATIKDKFSVSVCNFFRNEISKFERQMDCKVKRIRTDDGGEYEGALTPFLESLGVVHEPTSPHSPQSNGKAERLNRTLNEKVRTMLFQANMPKSFWAEAMATAGYLLNRLPSEAIDGRIPYEVWHEKPLPLDDLKSLRPFGCIVDIHVPKKRRKKRSKVDIRATRGCFIGYSESNDKYRVYDLERKTFVYLHDLNFNETKFPHAKDFDEPPADPMDHNPSSPIPSRSSTASPEPLQPSIQAEPPQTYDEITAVYDPILSVFKTYGDFEPDNDPPSMSDALK